VTRIGFLLSGLALIALSCSPNKGEDSASKAQEHIPTIRYGMEVDAYCESEGVVRPNQQFIEFLGGHPVSPRVLRDLNTVSRKDFDFRTIRAGNRFSLYTYGIHDSVRALVLVKDPVHHTIFHLKDSLRIEHRINPVDTLVRSTAGVIESNLSKTISDLGISAALTNRFVDIFAWKVDFNFLQKGDEFRILFEELSVNGEPYGIGRILGIRFSHSGKTDYAYPFDQGDGVDYFDQEGLSLRKALLKYPIEFTRISSRYSANRFHPILKINRAHLGTDLVAATGTPIRSVGDGQVIAAGHKGGNGNYVTIRHNGTYTTGYLHMSRIAEGISTGVRVRQGQVIGYVGQTGWATGPHLCYRFWKNGVQVDALKVELPADEPIRKQYQERFREIADSLTARLDAIAAASGNNNDSVRVATKDR